MGRPFLTGGLLLALAVVAPAQDKPATGPNPTSQVEPVPPGRTLVQAANALSWEEGDRKVTYLTGGATIRRIDFQLKAARMLAWSKIGGDSFEEIYAEGGVEIIRLKESLHCEQIYIDERDPAEPRAVIIDFRGETFSKEYGERFYVRAKEARSVARGVMVAKDISLSTCSYGVPHYHLSIDHGTFYGVEERTGKSNYDFWPYESWTLDADELYPELLGAPILFIPSMVVSPDIQEFPLRRLQGGHTSVYGYFAYTRWGVNLRKADDDGKWRPWAQVLLEADYRELRGAAEGLDFKYKWKDQYEGYINTYYMHDVFRDPNLGFNAKFGPLLGDDHDRGLVHLFHRQNFDEHWRFELESYYVSDAAFREEFFNKEFIEDKDPETAAYLRYVNGPMSAFLYERDRINRWETQNEYLPRFNFALYQVPVVRGALSDLYVSQTFDAARIRARFADTLNLPSEEVVRVDSTTELSLPIDCTYFQVAPFVQERLTYYDRDLEDQAVLRSLPTAGGSIHTQLHATWPDVTWDAVGLRGLRHILELEVKAAVGLNHTTISQNLFQLDEVDSLAPFEEITLGMHQRFKTKDDKGKPFEFLSVGVEVEYYPDAQRDTTTLRADNFLPPFNYILVSPRPDGTFPERHWSNVHYGLTFQPHTFFQASASGEYNPVDNVQDVRQIGVTIWPWQKTSLTAGQVYERGVTNAFAGTFTMTLTEKWKASVEAQYDLKAHHYLDQRLVVSRDFHDFLVEVVVENNTSTNDKRVYATFIPKFLGPQGERKSLMGQPGAGAAFTNPEP